MNIGTENEYIYYIEGLISDSITYVTLESLIALFTLNSCNVCNFKLIFVNTSDGESVTEELKPIGIGCQSKYMKIRLTNCITDYSFKSLHECPSAIRNCSFPVVHIEKENYCVVGLCSSLRYILIKINENLCNRLLGFRGGCLQACMEVSIWTNFCEIEVIETVKELYRENDHQELPDSDKLLIPANLLKYERHLEQPPILHNALKRKQENLQRFTNKETYLTLKNKQLKDLPDLEHKFAEGLELTLADVILYASFSLILHKFSNFSELKEICPLVLRWHSSMEQNDWIIENKLLLTNVMDSYSPYPRNSKFSVPEVARASLYKSDPKRYKAHWKLFTHQKDVNLVLEKLTGIQVSPSSVCIRADQSFNDWNKFDIKGSVKELMVRSTSYLSRNAIVLSNWNYKISLDWTSLPVGALPTDGKLPLSRFKRKCDQLEAMLKVVMSIAEPGNIVIDFCSGGGHLGILLAIFLPTCKILLVENKMASLVNAIARVQLLSLENVEFYQCNLDYLNAKFDIGVCLHACGVAADLVMNKCIRQKASFVCCPCCYGSIRPNDIIHYPRSSLFLREYEVTSSDFFVLAHTADQTHDNENPKSIQGRLCMEYVDYDRLSCARSCGYQIALTQMTPSNCTPKNHILIGIHEEKISSWIPN